MSGKRQQQWLRSRSSQWGGGRGEQSDIDVTNRSKLFKSMSSKLDVSALKIPCSEPSWFASRTKPDDIDETKHKINFLSVSCELVSFPMERNSNALSTSAAKFEYKLFSIDLCPEKVYLCWQARAYASEAPSVTCWQQPCPNSRGNICGFPWSVYRWG